MPFKATFTGDDALVANSYSKAVQRAACEEILEQVVAEEGQRVIGWRDVPIDVAHVGETARSVMPVFRQVFGPQADVRGDITVVGGGLSRDSGAVIRGAIKEIGFGDIPWRFPRTRVKAV